MFHRNETVTEWTKTNRSGHTVKLVRSEFDVHFQVGDGPWSVERQTAWQVFGDGLSTLGTSERDATGRFERA